MLYSFYYYLNTKVQALCYYSITIVHICSAPECTPNSDPQKGAMKVEEQMLISFTGEQTKTQMGLEIFLRSPWIVKVNKNQVLQVWVLAIRVPECIS